MRTFTISLLLTLAATGSYAQAVWTGPAGGGMMAVQEADVLEPGHFSFGFVGDNYDRNHGLGIDIVDVRLDWRFAVVSRLELYGRYQVTRSVSVPDTQVLPPPPTDIVVVTDMLTPQFPYRRVYWPMPYLGDDNNTGSGGVPGEYVFGIKGRLTRQQGWRPASAVSLQVSIPSTTSSDALAHGSGSGSIDWGIHTAATWQYRRLSASANLGYTFNANLNRPDRHVRVQFSPPYIYDTHGRRPNFLHGGLGLRYRLWREVSILGEASGWRPHMAHSDTIGKGPAADVLAGLEVRYKRTSLTVGVRQHLNVPRDGQALSTGEMGGGLDLSALPEGQRRDYLRSIGVDPALIRPGVNLVVLGGPSRYVPDPEGSRRIPPVSYMHTTGNTGIVASMSLTF